MKDLTGKITSIILAAMMLSCQPDRNTDENAVWCESIYLRGYRPSTKERLTYGHLERLSEVLTQNSITSVYLFAGPYGKDGCLPQYAFSVSAQKAVAYLQSHNPGLRILPWLGGIENNTVSLNDSTWVNNALMDTQKLVKVLGVDGVHIDFEFLLPGNSYLDTTIEKERPGERERYGENVNAFHKRLRDLIPDHFISAVVACTSPRAKQWKRKTTLEELQGLVPLVDQLSFLFYDTSINDQKDFEEACRNQLEDVRRLRIKTPDAKTQFLLAVGTFVNLIELQGFRDLSIENLPNTLTTISDCIKQTKTDVPLINGIAIFCDWETDLVEWKEFQKYWVQR
jgi:hypothetical protein